MWWNSCIIYYFCKKNIKSRSLYLHIVSIPNKNKYIVSDLQLLAIQSFLVFWSPVRYSLWKHIKLCIRALTIWRTILFLIWLWLLSRNIFLFIHNIRNVIQIMRPYVLHHSIHNEYLAINTLIGTLMFAVNLVVYSSFITIVYDWLFARNNEITAMNT